MSSFRYFCDVLRNEKDERWSHVICRQREIRFQRDAAADIAFSLKCSSSSSRHKGVKVYGKQNQIRINLINICNDQMRTMEMLNKDSKQHSREVQDLTY